MASHTDSSASSGSVSIWRRRLSGRGDRYSRRAGILFMVGSACFALGSVPLYFLTVNSTLVGATFFVGSIFFTSAGVTQWRQIAVEPGDGMPPGWLRPRSMAWWAVVIQFIGMLFFNVNTFRAGFGSVATAELNRLVWAPDFFGSVAFLVASHLAWLVVCGRLWCVRRDSADWWIAALNYAGSIFFMASALAAFTIPATGDVVSVALVNLGTFAGAVGFFLGGYLLLPAKTLS